MYLHAMMPRSWTSTADFGRINVCVCVCSSLAPPLLQQQQLQQAQPTKPAADPQTPQKGPLTPSSNASKADTSRMAPLTAPRKPATTHNSVGGVPAPPLAQQQAPLRTAPNNTPAQASRPAASPARPHTASAPGRAPQQGGSSIAAPGIQHKPVSFILVPVIPSFQIPVYLCSCSPLLAEKSLTMMRLCTHACIQNAVQKKVEPTQQDEVGHYQVRKGNMIDYGAPFTKGRCVLNMTADQNVTVRPKHLKMVWMAVSH